MGDTTSSESWRTVAAGKRAERDAKIPTEWRIPASLLPSPETQYVQDFPQASGMFTEQELAITELTAYDVVAKIAAGELTALEVTLAVWKKAAVPQQLLNCVTEIRFDDAIARAKELDSYFKKEGKTVGPLHGLPVRYISFRTLVVQACKAEGNRKKGGRGVSKSV